MEEFENGSNSEKVVNLVEACKMIVKNQERAKVQEAYQSGYDAGYQNGFDEGIASVHKKKEKIDLKELCKKNEVRIQWLEKRVRAIEDKIQFTDFRA
ncbi:MAG: hypothetical protein V4549_03555 [Bacteroidota bacterium]